MPLTSSVMLNAMLPLEYIAGLVLSNNAGDPNNSIDFGTGKAIDSTNAFNMTLSAQLTKQLSAAWAAGNNVGGLFSGAKAASTWYHCFLIRKSSDGSIDCGFDTSVTAANIPAGYSAKRLIGSIFTDGSGNITGFKSYEWHGGGILTMWNSPTLDVNLANTLTTAARVDAIKVPTGYKVQALTNIRLFDGASAFDAYLSDPDTTDLAPSSTAGPLLTGDGITTKALQIPFTVTTNNLGQIRARASLATVDQYRVATLGWLWGRR